MISEVYNCNCLEYMKSLPDKHFDLCIADPPFGINIHKSGRLKKYNKQWVDDGIPTKEVFDEMFRCSKDVILEVRSAFLYTIRNNQKAYRLLRASLHGLLLTA